MTLPTMATWGCLRNSAMYHAQTLYNKMLTDVYNWDYSSFSYVLQHQHFPRNLSRFIAVCCVVHGSDSGWLDTFADSVLAIKVVRARRRETSPDGRNRKRCVKSLSDASDDGSDRDCPRYLKLPILNRSQWVRGNFASNSPTEIG